MLRIDGAHGEGGGQILRSALTLATVTGEAFEMFDIRAGRSRPGLMPQHVKAVEAAAAVSGGVVEGAAPGSRTLLFRPGPVVPGDYRFDIGTAGSAPLVLQTVLLPLALANSPSRVTVTGGTHVPWSPCYDYLELQWIPWLRQMGMNVGTTMARAGFYPRGGGVIEASIAPSPPPSPLRLTDRGPLRRIRLLSMVARLPAGIAERQARAALASLSPWPGEREVHIVERPSAGPGTMLLAQGVFEGGTVTAFALGARGKPAEKVGEEAADALARVLRSDAAVDEHGADQILIPLALAQGPSVYATPCVTRHLETVAWVTRIFLPAGIAIEGEEGFPGTVRIRGGDFALQRFQHPSDGR